MANLLLLVMGAFAKSERAMILERQREGIAAAKTRGAYTGRKPALSDEQATATARPGGRRRTEVGAGQGIRHQPRNRLQLPAHRRRRISATERRKPQPGLTTVNHSGKEGQTATAHIRNTLSARRRRADRV
ncbi:recombinase family protein [Nocardia sp. GAS34]|uniref:recombinase family protein n=1 Tax=unclassified Nocardia TaxID=2637762 RepID=UPI003D19C752